MAAADEESGKLPESLQNVGSLREAEAEHSLGIAVQLLEPLILAGMGLFVGVFVIATAPTRSRADQGVLTILARFSRTQASLSDLLLPFHARVHILLTPARLIVFGSSPGLID